MLTWRPALGTEQLTGASSPPLGVVGSPSPRPGRQEAAGLGDVPPLGSGRVVAVGEIS